MDPAIAAADRQRGWLTGEAARKQVHRLRSAADAIAIGIGTAIADDPQLTVRGVRKPRVAPLRVVFDRQARLPITSRLVRTAKRVPVLLVTSDAHSDDARAVAEKGVETLEAHDLPVALRALHERGVRHLLVEGGASLAGALLGGNLVDRLVIFQAPLLLGAGSLGAFSAVPSVATDDLARWRVVERAEFDDDLMTVLAPPSP
jgi:diaminohydroxyphosphoribosylaminopyrimidine deaminase/5-amino-6-(5-phosphoribosylamino)uracil reductase